MAVILYDGFDHLGSAGLGLKWDGTNGSPTVDATGGRNGKGCFSGSQAWVSKNFGSSLTTVIMSGAFKFTQNGTNAHFMELLDGNASNRVVSGLMWASDNTIKIDQPDNGNNILLFGSPTLTVGNWYYIEWKMTIGASISAHTCVVRVNGAVALDIPAGTDTRYISTSVTRGSMGSISGAINSFTVKMDDVVILSTSGSPNDFLADVTIESLLPAASGNYTAFSLVGAASKVAAVNEVPEDGDTSYVASAVVGNRESFTFGALTGTPNTILAIQKVSTIRKQGTGTRSIKGFYRIGGVDYDGSAIALGDNYAVIEEPAAVNPATGVAWTASDIAAIEAGVKVDS